jgi:hypothetical protein
MAHASLLQKIIGCLTLLQTSQKVVTGYAVTCNALSCLVNVQSSHYVGIPRGAEAEAVWSVGMMTTRGKS